MKFCREINIPLGIIQLNSSFQFLINKAVHPLLILVILQLEKLNFFYRLAVQLAYRINEPYSMLDLNVKMILTV
jgi:hypothetical protein